MSFKIRPARKISVVVKGILQSPIDYEVRQADGNWQSSLPTFYDQRIGQFDTESCWAAATIGSLEIQLDWLWSNGYFSPDAKNFLSQYLDGAGKFSISKRFIEILGGNKENGGTAQESCQLIQKYGVVPDAMLSYTDAQAALQPSTTAFIADYFNTNAVTETMKSIGLTFLTHVNIAYQRVGSMWQTPNAVILQAALKQAPLSIGIPIPVNVFNWNLPVVEYDGSTVMQHEVCLYGMDANKEYLIRDQYMPDNKALSADYLIPSVTQLIAAVIAPAEVNPVPQPTGVQNDSWWSAVMQWFNGILNPIPVGSS